MQAALRKKDKLRLIDQIPGRIILVLTVTMIPIILLAVVLSLMAMRLLERQVYVANQNELAQFRTYMDLELETIQGDINDVLADHSDFFLQGEMQAPDLVPDLREVRERNDILRCVYLVAGDREEDIMLHYDPEKVSYQEAGALRSEMAKADLREIPTRSFRVMTFQDEAYLVYKVDSIRGAAMIGFMIDLKDLLEPVRSSEQGLDAMVISKDGQFFDENGEVPSAEVPEYAVYDGIAGKGGTYCVSAGSTICDYGFVRIMDQNTILAGMPLIQRHLWILAVLSILLLPLIWGLLRRMIIRPLGRLQAAMQNIEEDHIEYRMEAPESAAEFEYIRSTFNDMADEIQNLRIQAYEREIEKLRIEADNIRLQISPHMLMNSLNMIYNLSLSRNNKVIQQFTLCLSDYFRYSLTRHEDTVPISEELKFVESYLNVQKVRFPGRFVYVYDIPEEIMEVQIPPLLIQNFVENTIKYGLKMDDEIEIILTVTADEERISISIDDTGAGMSPEVLENLRSGEAFEDKNGRHIGIWNCRRRLAMLYGGRAVLTITSAPNEGTQVHIELPGGKNEGTAG